ncbi:MAG: amidohydrolase family protein [Desulfobacterales bacterium]|nr:amidohydrolase family protein [Desulfobacterales bacterium]
MNRRNFLKNAWLSAAGILLGKWPIRQAHASQNEQSEANDLKTEKIDFYCHFSTMKIIDYLEAAGGPKPHVFRRLFANTPTLIDSDKRLRLMDDFSVTRSVLVPLPWLETAPAVHIDSQKCLKAAQILNNEMARIVSKHPDRFSAVAVLPATNAQIMLAELNRAVKELNMVGGMFVVGPTVKRPDHPDYEQLYAEAAKLDVPLWIHPSRPPIYPDYIDESVSKFQVWQTLTWLEDSSTAMVRIVFAGVFDRYPDLKLIIHHAGALIPLYAQRMQYGWDYFEQNTGKNQPTTISKPYIEHFKKFYCDTATQGNQPKLLEIASDFFGSERVLFGTDAPMEATAGRAFTGDAIASVAGMNTSKANRQAIFRDNAQRILRLG